MSKKDVAQQIVTQMIKALQDKGYIKRLTVNEYGLSGYDSDLLPDDLEQLRDKVTDILKGNRTHCLNINQEQKERSFERDLADRRNTECMTERQARIVDSILRD